MCRNANTSVDKRRVDNVTTVVHVLLLFSNWTITRDNANEHVG